MRYLIFCFSLGFAAPVFADSPQITDVNATPDTNGWRFDVTLLHADTGWDDYADGWRVELEDGTVLNTRELLHPHVNEQPFTRSLSAIAIPKGTKTVFVRAKDNIGGWAKETVAYDLPQ